MHICELQTIPIAKQIIRSRSFSDQASFYTPAFKDVAVHVFCHTAVIRLYICLYDIIFATPPKLIERFWWSLKDYNMISIYKGNPPPNFKRVMALGLWVFYTKYFVFTISHWENFNETRYQERSQCVDVIFTRRMLPLNFLKELLYYYIIVRVKVK
jgi:hypothetical protein